VGDENIGEGVFLVQSAYHLFRSIFSKTDRVIALALATRTDCDEAMHSSPQNSPLLSTAMVASFPALATTLSLIRPLGM
jgi:hypothetical protein